MPTTYAHDAFGKEAYQRLNPDIKAVIKKYKRQYLIGLHGPDIFFYYRPFKKNAIFDLGMKLHGEDAYPFFEEAIEKYKQNPNQAMLAYILGFACHFMLDSTCHPFIFLFQDATGLSHSEIETAFDKKMMLRDHKNPYQYLPACSICPKATDNYVICEIFPQLDRKQLAHALTGMGFYTSATVTDKRWKREITAAIAGLFGDTQEMRGRVIRFRDNPECTPAINQLEILYAKALEETPDILENVYFSAVGNVSLSNRFSRNYR